MANPKRGLFTSESVSEGHPDKIADQISDAVLDAILQEDPEGRVACECLVKSGMVLVAGEISTDAWVDIDAIARQVIHDIGYVDQPTLGFDAHACAIMQSINQQSPDIAAGIEHQDDARLGAGDQGLMFGYATDETPTHMPAPIHYAHALTRRHAACRKSGQLPWLGPDAKAQITCIYEDHQPIGIDNVVFSTQHHPDMALSSLRQAIMHEVLLPTLPQAWITEQTRFHINPAGRFVLGGPSADCGLTGRKIMVDTYGGIARHGGGAFSGKDPSKVDRSAAYMARFLAKYVVTKGMAKRCEVQITYAIGMHEPTSLLVETFGTSDQEDQSIATHLQTTFDLTPYGLITFLKLKRPIYRKTATYGHFGSHDPEHLWEQVT